MELGVRPLPRLYEVLVFFCTLSFISSAMAAATRGSCRLIGEEKLIDIEGCPLQVVRVNSCAGYCHSHALYNPIDGSFLRRAECCRMVDKDYVEQKLRCAHGEETVRIPTAIQCACMECAPTGDRR